MVYSSRQFPFFSPYIFWGFVDHFVFVVSAFISLTADDGPQRSRLVTNPTYYYCKVAILPVVAVVTVRIFSHF